MAVLYGLAQCHKALTIPAMLSREILSQGKKPHAYSSLFHSPCGNTQACLQLCTAGFWNTVFWATHICQAFLAHYASVEAVHLLYGPSIQLTQLLRAC